MEGAKNRQTDRHFTAVIEKPNYRFVHEGRLSVESVFKCYRYTLIVHTKSIGVKERN